MPSVPSPARASLSLAPLALVALVAPFVHLGPFAAIALAFAAAACAVLIAADALAFAPKPSRGMTLALLALSATLIVAGYFLADRVEVLSGLAGSAGVLLGAALVGAIVGARVGNVGHLPAVAMASSAADVWSVHSPQGITHAMVTVSDAGLQRLFAVSAAVAPLRTPEAMIGGGDVVFAALYLATTRRHGLSRVRTLGALALGLALALAGTFVLRRPLPALPFLGACVVAAHPAAWRIPRKDWGATGVAAVLFVAAVAHAVRG